jgi:small subunit ribosomal protein S9
MSTTKTQQDTTWGLGRRKSAVARVRLTPGAGEMTVNGRDLETYFPLESERAAVRLPLKVCGLLGRCDVAANIEGGGRTGQAEAVTLGVARALLKMDPGLKDTLREHGLLTRDSRQKERKKPGLRGARRAPQFSKR